MKENELRIGNYILYQNQKECKVSSIGSNGFETEYIGKSQPNGSNDIREYQPIPLTEEELIKLGFIKKRNLGDLFFEKWVFRLFVDHKGFYLFIDCDYEYGIVEHVHELQNLYFALTGEELTHTSNTSKV